MSKPKMYELWFSDYDGNSSWQFTHGEDKSKEDFEKDCKEVLQEFGEASIKKIRCWVGSLDILRIVAEKLPTRGYIPFEDIYETIGFGMGGSCIIQKERHDDENEDVLNLLGDGLTKLVYKINNKIEKSMNKK